MKIGEEDKGGRLKCDFHLHTSDDPVDHICHSFETLVANAAELGYDVLCVTNHNVVSHTPEHAKFAESKGILLIPGVEIYVKGKHVVIINAPKEAEKVSDFEGLGSLRAGHPEIFVMAPHPYYPKGHCLGKLLDEHIGLFDGIEYCHYYVSIFNIFNARAARTARKSGRTLVGNSDTHDMRQFASTYSLVDSEKDISSVVSALKQGRVEVVSSPLSIRTCLELIGPVGKQRRYILL